MSRLANKPPIAFLNLNCGPTDPRNMRPVGIAYIMAHLRTNGYESVGIDLKDERQESAEEVVAHLHLDKYAVVAMGVYNETAEAVIAVGQALKRAHPQALVVLGGPHATATHMDLASTPGIDIVVRREGEETMLEIVRSLEADIGYEGIAGTTVNRGSEPIVNPDRELSPDLDSLGFPDATFAGWDGEISERPLTYYRQDLGGVVPALQVISSRSCPYNCAFCGVLTIGRTYRVRSVENVVAEIDYFRRRDGIAYKHVYFNDANFFVDAERSLNVARALSEYDSELTFSFSSRVNQILRATEHLAELRDLGLRYVEVGVESASKPVLKRLGKGVTPLINEAGIAALRRADIEVALDFIMFDPESTLDDLADNFRFLREYDFYDSLPHDPLYTSLTLYAGTPIREYFDRKYTLALGPHELPSEWSFFVDEGVGKLAEFVQLLRRSVQPLVDELSYRCQTLLLQSAGALSSETFGELQLRELSLRHLPYMLAESALKSISTTGKVAPDHDSRLRIGPKRESPTLFLNRTEAVLTEIEARVAEFRVSASA